MSQKDKLYEEALKYHTKYPYGKIYTSAKECSDEELKYAYSPGVAAACLEIEKDPKFARYSTLKGNHVCIVSNGTAVLGLGDIGALASKPVMEGKCLLMKNLAGIDGTDLCISEKNVDKLAEIIKSFANSCGIINLEDIKAPECFELLEKLQQELDIPVFHDDQDGTASVACAAIMNALDIVNKNISEIKIVCSGAGAAMIATIRMLELFGLQTQNIYMFDSKGFLNNKRTALNKYKQYYAEKHSQDLTIQEALVDADAFIGLSGPGVLKGGDIKDMKSNPIILALANPIPEIMPEEVYEARSDAIVATGRSDYPNQVNNSVCFPYLFRATLDSQAKKITSGMIKAFIEGIKDITKMDPEYGKNYILPSMLDKRLPYKIVPKIIQAAIDDNVAENVSFTDMYKHLYSNLYWDYVLESEAHNSIATGEENAWIMEEMINVLSDKTKNSKFKIITSAKQTHIDQSTFCMLKIGEKLVFDVSKNFGVEKLKNILENSFGEEFTRKVTVTDSGNLCDLGELVCSVNLESREIYLDKNIHKYPFTIAFNSRLKV